MLATRQRKDRGLAPPVLAERDAAALVAALPHLRLLEIEVKHYLLPQDPVGRSELERESPSSWTEEQHAWVARPEVVAALRRAAPGLEIRFV